MGIIAQGTTHAENQFFWRVEYERPLFQSYHASFSYDENEFDVLGEFRDRGIASDTRNAHLTLSKSYIRSRQRNLDFVVDLGLKRARTKVRGRERSKDSLTTMLFGLDFDSVDTRFAGLNAAQIQFTHGINDVFGAMGGQGAAQNASVPPSRRGGSRRFATGEFDKLFLSYTRFQALSILSEKLRQHSILFRSEGQWSGDVLVPLEQYAIGGPNNVRAYQPTEELFDKALFFSVEWIVNAPFIADEPSPFGNRSWGELVQLSVFADWAYGKLNDPLRSEFESQNYFGPGFSFSFTNPNKFSTRMTIAFPIGDDPRPVNGRDPQYWLDFNVFY